MWYWAWVSWVLIDEEKNGSGRKLLNPPESEGHPTIQTSHFIPVTADRVGSYSYLLWLFRCALKTWCLTLIHFICANSIMDRCCTVTYVLFEQLHPVPLNGSLALLQEEMSQWMKRRTRMSIWICSMILAWTAILIQRQESTMNWHDLKSIRAKNNKSNWKWMNGFRIYQLSLLIGIEFPIQKKITFCLSVRLWKLTGALCHHM